MATITSLSFIAPGLAQPIATFLDHLFASKDPGSTEVKTSEVEAGYSCAIIILLVIRLESYAERTLAHPQGKRLSERGKPLGFLADVCTSVKAAQLRELFVVRDAIAHAHLWEIKWSGSFENWMRVLAREIPERYGDTKFEEAVNRQTGLTRVLGLNVVPTKITRHDVRVVLSTVLLAIRDLDKALDGLLSTDTLYVDFRQRFQSFLAVGRSLGAFEPDI